MPSMGSGAADGLREVLQGLYLRTIEQNRRRAQDADNAFRVSEAAGSAQRWQADFDLRKAKQERDVTDAEAAADAERTARANRQAALDAVLNDPSIPPPTKNLLRLGQVGLGANLNTHALEAPDAHAAHVAADAQSDDDRKFAGWKREQDYSEQLRRGRPRIAGRLVQDDPALPAGVKAGLARYVAQGLSYDEALQALTREIPNQLSIHPNLDPQKAITALQGMYRQPTGTRTPSGDLIGRFVGSVGGAQGRGAAPRQSAPGAAGGRVVTMQELQAIAEARGTSVDDERARATARGYTVQ
jgi:hypothetical protein